MRPDILFPLFADITSLKGVGPRMGPLYKRLCGPHVVDMLWHLPTGLIDRRYSPQLKYADNDRVATLTLKIAEHAPPRRPSLPYRIIGYDDTDQVTITYFNVKGDYLGKMYPTDRPVVVSGLLERYQGGWRMSHPDYVLPPERAAEIPPLEPIYPLTAGLTGKFVRKTVQTALAKLPDLPEWHDPHLLHREKWPDLKTALTSVHENPLSRKVCATSMSTPSVEPNPIKTSSASTVFQAVGSSISFFRPSIFLWNLLKTMLVRISPSSVICPSSVCSSLSTYITSLTQEGTAKGEIPDSVNAYRLYPVIFSDSSRLMIERTTLASGPSNRSMSRTESARC